VGCLAESFELPMLVVLLLQLFKLQQAEFIQLFLLWRYSINQVGLVQFLAF